MTLDEYLQDYASDETKKVGENLISKEVEALENPEIKAVVKKNLDKISKGERNFKF